MKALRRVWNRLAGSLAGRRREADLAEEFESHIEMLTAENLRRGMSPAEARREALLTFGGVEKSKDDYRDQRGLPWLDSLRQDVRYGLRGMRKRPAFTAVALTCLTLGIGANTAVFSLFNAVMLRSLPVSHPEQLVFFEYTSPGGSLGALRRTSSGYRTSLPYATYEAFRDQARSLAGVFVFVSSGIEGHAATVNVGGRAVAADAEMVTGNYFSVLGVSPMLGRTIEDGDLDAGAGNVTVLSHSFWSREFGGDVSALGRSIGVNGTSFRIVGVSPPGFVGLHGAVPDLWVPLRPTDDMRPWGSRAGSAQVFFSDRRWWWCTIGARLKPGVSRAQAQAETDYLFRQSITAGLSSVPPSLPRIELSQASPVFESMRLKLAAPLQILMVTAGLVLLIACANLAALLVSRAQSRQREIGVRLAIGASRARLARQLLTESLLLSLSGGAFGLLAARWGGAALLGLIAGDSQTALLNVSPDCRVLAFAAVVSVATGVLFGLAPAWRATRMDLAPRLKESAASTTPHRGAARLLVASQIAISVVLLFGAGLFVRTLRNLDGQDLGFTRENLLLFEVDPERSGYKGASGIALNGRLLEEMQRLPGVRSATFSQMALLSGWRNTSPTGTDGPPLPAGQPNEIYYNRVGPRFFETMGMRVVLGRGIGLRDTEQGRTAAVVNEAWARAFFPGESPVGHRVSVGGDRLKPDQAYEIVGVAEDAKYDQIRGAPPRTVFLSYGAAWDRSRRLCFALRSAGDPLALAGSVRAAIRRIEPNLPVFNMKTQRQQIDEALGQERMLARISAFFGGLALLLVAVGIYGTLSYAVTQRTGEVGIRMALGAGRPEVVWMILRESLVVAGIGLAGGLPAALGLSRLASSSLYGVTTYDGFTIAATVALLSGIAAAAGFVPAYRAARIDPIRALRHD